MPLCVIVDVPMPDMTGLDLQKVPDPSGVRKNNSCFITGHGEHPHVCEAIKAGAVDFLVKPLDPQPAFELR